MMPSDEMHANKGNWFVRHNRLTKGGIALLIIVVLLIALRAALPVILQRYVNNKIDESPDYAGQVGDIDLFLLAGSYDIQNIEINKTSGEVPVPLFSAVEARFSLLWSALFDGAVVGEVELFEPVINIVDSENEANQQTGEGGPWLTIIDGLFPLRIDHVTVHQGQLHFQNFDAEPPVDIFLSNIEAEVRNLTNSEDLAQTMISRLGLTAVAMEQGDLAADMAFDPSLENPTFDLNARLLHLPIIELDEFIATYAPFDVEAGSVDVVLELAAEEGNLDGYVKPLIHDLKVFTWHGDIEEDNDNPFRALWEGIVGLVTELLENQLSDQFATRIPLTGPIEQPEAGIFAAVINVLRNAFIEALRADIEDSVSLNLGEEEEPVSMSTEYETEIGEIGVRDDTDTDDTDTDGENGEQAPSETQSPVNN